MMNRTPKLVTLTLSVVLLPALHAQTSTPAPQTSTPSSATPAAAAKRTPPQPAAQQAPGAGPDKVWVNNKSKVYHCPSDRYYGRTKDGKYMTEADAKAAGAHGEDGKTCFK